MIVFLVGMGLCAVFGLILGISVIRGVLKKRYPLKLWAWLCAALFISGIVLVDGALQPLLDDGPFYGEPVEPSALDPERSPDQIFCCAAGQLETFDAQGPDQEFPIVRLRNDEGELVWSIQASAYEGNSVQIVRFEDSMPWITGPIVTGRVHWDYGNERAQWFFWWGGKLRGYWFSW